MAAGGSLAAMCSGASAATDAGGSPAAMCSAASAATAAGGSPAAIWSGAPAATAAERLTGLVTSPTMMRPRRCPTSFPIAVAEGSREFKLRCLYEEASSGTLTPQEFYKVIQNVLGCVGHPPDGNNCFNTIIDASGGPFYPCTNNAASASYPTLRGQCDRADNAQGRIPRAVGGYPAARHQSMEHITTSNGAMVEVAGLATMPAICLQTPLFPDCTSGRSPLRNSLGIISSSAGGALLPISVAQHGTSNGRLYLFMDYTRYQWMRNPIGSRLSSAGGGGGDVAVLLPLHTSVSNQPEGHNMYQIAIVGLCFSAASACYQAYSEIEKAVGLKWASWAFGGACVPAAVLGAGAFAARFNKSPKVKVFNEYAMQVSVVAFAAVVIFNLCSIIFLR